MKKYFIFIVLMALLFSISSVCSEEIGDNSTLEVDDNPIEIENTGLHDDESIQEDFNEENSLKEEKNESDICTSSNQESKLENDEEIIVEDWEDIKYYALKTDKNYVIKLKENTNYYPQDYAHGGSIIIRNNLTILGNSGAYIGYATKNAPKIQFTPFRTEQDTKIGIVLDGVKFKYFSTSTGVMFELWGNTNNTVRNCQFENIVLAGSKSTTLHIKKGFLLVENCTFVNSTQYYGCISVYCPDDNPSKLCTSSKAVVKDCYFQNNYATQEPGCINNCGVLTVYNTTFIKNSAQVWAGAIHTHGGANTTIYDSNFIDNVAGWNGGALYTYSYLQIYNTRFIGNNCTTNFGGGAIGACYYQSAPHIYIEDCYFENNENLCWALNELSTEGTGRGGAISIMDTGSLKVYNTTFVENSASIGPAISAHAEQGYGSPDIEISGNKFINNTRAGDVLVIKVDSTENLVHDNYYYNNSMEYSRYQLSIVNVSNDDVTFQIDAKLVNPNYYDEDILDKCEYDVFVDGTLFKKITESTFTITFEDLKTYEIQVIASISNKISNIVSVEISKELIYVSKMNGNDNNNGLSENAPVYSLKKAVELAKSIGNIFIIDGNYNDENLFIDYNLTIFGNNSKISDFSVEDTIFESTSSKLILKDFYFSNLNMIHDTSTIIKQHAGLLILDRCAFDSNTFNTMIDAENIEIRNTIFENNNASIETVTLTFNNVIFVNNTRNNHLIKSKSDTGNWNIKNSNFIDNSGSIYYSSNLNTLTVEKSVFKNNDGEYCLVIDESAKLDVSSSIFINNNGIINIADSDVIVNVRDSVILNNSNGIIGGVIVNENIDCNYNWWGNVNDENIHNPVNLNPEVELDNWLFLNISPSSDILEFNQNEAIKFSLNNLMTKSGDILKYNYNLPKLNFDLNPINAKVNKNSIILGDRSDEVIYALTSSNDGSLYVNYETFEIYLNYKFLKSDCERNIIANPIFVKNDAKIQIILSEFATGNLTVSLNDYNETKRINNQATIFTISNLEVGKYTVEVAYSGDEIYNSFTDNVTLIVNKIQTDVIISIGDVKLGKDVLITVNVPSDATGNITILVNGNETSLETENGKVTYTINNITKGDWEIQAVYGGDGYYNASSSYKKFSVGKIDSSAMINVLNTKYNEDAVIEVYLNNDATGNVTVIVDDKNKTSEVVDGKVIISLSGLSAGNKKIKVLYSGDITYNNATYSSSFMIEKINTAFNMTCDNIMEGKTAIVEVQIPYGVTGTVTLKCEGVKETLTIPKSGWLSWSIPLDLSVGEHTVSANYNGDNNYYGAKNNATILVSPWNLPQWANKGFDVNNNGKSPYDSDVNGQIKWFAQNNGTKTGNIVIDSEGNIYIITESGISSYDGNGMIKWNYSSSTLNTFSGMSVGRDVIIAPVSGDTLYFINQTNGERFGYSNIYQASSLFSPVIDSNSNIYVTGEKDVSAGCFYLVIVPYKLWEDGGEPTLISLGQSNPTTAPVIVSDNIVCVGTDEGLKIIDTSSNTVINNFKNIVTNIRPIANEGIIYVATNDSLVALDIHEGQLWKTDFSAKGCKCLVFDDENGRLYSVDNDGNIYKYDSLNSGEETFLVSLNVSSGILLGSNGELYVGYDDYLACIDSNGKLLWKSEIGDGIVGTPVMDKNGIIYATTSKGLFAIMNAPLKDFNLDASIDTVHYGSDVTVNMTFDVEATGEITIKFNNETYSNEITNGKLDIAIPKLNVGNYDIQIIYSGDKRYFGIDKIVYVNVTKVETSADDISIPSDFSVNNPSFTINLPSDATGTLTVTVDGEKYSQDLLSGVATVSIPKLAFGKHNIVLTYSGDNNYASVSTFKTVNIPYPKITDNDNVVMDYNDGSSYGVRVIGSDGKNVVGGYVTFNINGKSVKVQTDRNGFASLKITEIPNKYTITATYNGITVKNTVTVKQILKSKNFKVKKTAKKLILKATLKSSNGKALKGKQIVFKFNGKTYKAKTNKKGIAKVTIKKKVIKKLKTKKKYALQITYLKDTIKKTVTVK